MLGFLLPRLYMKIDHVVHVFSMFKLHNLWLILFMTPVDNWKFNFISPIFHSSLIGTLTQANKVLQAVWPGTTLSRPLLLHEPGYRQHRQHNLPGAHKHKPLRTLREHLLKLRQKLQWVWYYKDRDWYCFYINIDIFVTIGSDLIHLTPFKCSYDIRTCICHMFRTPSVLL